MQTLLSYRGSFQTPPIGSSTFSPCRRTIVSQGRPLAGNRQERDRLLGYYQSMSGRRTLGNFPNAADTIPHHGDQRLSESRESVEEYRRGTEQGRRNTRTDVWDRSSYSLLPSATPSQTSTGSSPVLSKEDAAQELEGPSKAVSSSTSGTQMLAQPAPSTLVRTPRRTKTHVASACINCKKAHLSCDSGRPCTRCVASGKQATCIDVQHKKRGRPRLRDDRPLQMERMRSEPMAQSAGTPSSPFASRTSYPRNWGSHRTTKSLTESPRILNPSHCRCLSAGDATRRVPNVTLDTRSLPNSSNSRVNNAPIAYLQWSFDIVKCNEAFADLLGLSQDRVRGRNISEVLAPQDLGKVNKLKDALQEERNARDPNLLPPINTKGEAESIDRVLETDFGFVTNGASERRENLLFRLPNGQYRNISTHVLLAKTSFYFVAIYLPHEGRVLPSTLSSPTSPRHLSHTNSPALSTKFSPAMTPLGSDSRFKGYPLSASVSDQPASRHTPTSQTSYASKFFERDFSGLGPTLPGRFMTSHQKQEETAFGSSISSNEPIAYPVGFPAPHYGHRTNDRTGAGDPSQNVRLPPIRESLMSPLPPVSSMASVSPSLKRRRLNDDDEPPSDTQSRKGRRHRVSVEEMLD